MGILSFTDRRTRLATPVFLKIMVIIQGVMILFSSGNIYILRFVHGHPVPFSTTGLLAVSLLVQALALRSMWNLRKWAVLAFALFLLMGVTTYLSTGGAPNYVNGLVMVILFRSLVLIPGLIYWRRMTW